MAGCTSNTEVVAALCIRVVTGQTDVPAAFLIIPHSPTVLMAIATGHMTRSAQIIFTLP
jgi:hypothetical protein